MNRPGRDSPKLPAVPAGGERSESQPQNLIPTLGSTLLSYGPAASDSCDAVVVPLGFEKEHITESNSSPTRLRWPSNLRSLLQDVAGLELFRKYLDQEESSSLHANPLNFWFACEGLKEQRDPAKIRRLVKLIFKRFFLQSQLAIPENVREEASRRVKEDRRADERVFDVVQTEVERLINETACPNFLRSDLYLRYVRSCQSYADISRGPSWLPLALRKDSEFLNSVRNLGSTRNVLATTRQAGPMDLWSKSEAYAGDGTSMDGQRTSDERCRRRCGPTKESARSNRDPVARCTHVVVSRARCLVQPSKPETFARVLIEKLRNIEQERNAKETFEGRVPSCATTIGADSELDLSRAGEKLSSVEDDDDDDDDDSDQAILDRHVSRVWTDLRSRPVKISHGYVARPKKGEGSYPRYALRGQRLRSELELAEPASPGILFERD